MVLQPVGFPLSPGSLPTSLPYMNRPWRGCCILCSPPGGQKNVCPLTKHRHTAVTILPQAMTFHQVHWRAAHWATTLEHPDFLQNITPHPPAPNSISMLRDHSGRNTEILKASRLCRILYKQTSDRIEDHKLKVRFPWQMPSFRFGSNSGTKGCFLLSDSQFISGFRKPKMWPE